MMAAHTQDVPADVRAFAALAVRARHSSSRRGFPVLNLHTGLGRYEIARRMRLYWRTDWSNERVSDVLSYLVQAGAVVASGAGGLVVTEWERVEALAGGSR